MPPQPPPPTGDQILAADIPPPASESKRFIPTPFLTKTYQLVDDLSIDNIISWNDDGTSFVIWNPAEFARDVLPKFFKHNNFSSFVRQLNTYGFRKVMPDRWEFSNDCFRRGDKHLLCDIVRRKLTSGPSSSINTAPSHVPMEPSTSNSGEGLGFSSNSTPTSAAPTATAFLDQSISNNSSNNNYNSCSLRVGGSSSRAHLMDENDRLKKENTQLCKELIQMKSMCTNIYSMMSNYNPGTDPVPVLDQGRSPQAMLSAVGFGSSNSSQARSMMNPPTDLISGRSLAAVEESQAAQAANEEDINLLPKLFGFQLGPKRARTDSSSGDPMELEDDLLQQPGSSLSR